MKLFSLALGAAACRLFSLPQTPTPSTYPSPTRPFTATPPEPIATATATEPPPEPTPTEGAATDTPVILPFPPLVIDGHQDIAWNALEFGRDPLQSVVDARPLEAASRLSNMLGERTTGLPECLSGRVGVIFATLFVMPARANYYPGYNKMNYDTPKQAEALARQQLAYYQELAAGEERLELIYTLTDLEVVVSTWMDPALEPKVGLVILMEGADPILSPSDLEDWHQSGLRLIGPAWKGTRYSGGTGEPGPLTALGRELLSAMAEFNMILDLSHIAEAAYLEAVESYSGPIIASHSNPRRFLPTDRGLSDEMIAKLIARDGVVGVVLYNRYLDPNWRHGDPRQSVTLETVADVIDHVAQLAGDAQHVALGSDFDGGFGQDAIPQGMDSVADLVKIADALAGRGYSQADIQAVMYGNWLRVLQSSLPGA